MSRIRTVKPDFFKHEELYQAEEKSRLPLRIAFAGLWTVADREGRFKWKPNSLKLDVIPFDKASMDDVLNALAKYGFIVKYSVDGKEFGVIPSFKEHQVINLREAKSSIPEPPGYTPKEPSYDDNLQKIKPEKLYTLEDSAKLNGINIPPALRQTVLYLDGFKCRRCGSEDHLSVDHIFPQSSGGTHLLTNLRTLCRKCNSARPTQGKALEEDLAIDGLTWDDMPRMCTHVRAHGEGKGKEGKGREHIQVACAVCSIFGKHYLLPEERHPQTANWFRTIDHQVDKLLEVLKPDEAVNQITAYLRHCDETGRKRIATDFKVAETILSVNWTGISAPEPVPKNTNPYSDAEYNRTLWTEAAWREKYDRQIKTDQKFREYFKITTQ